MTAITSEGDLSPCSQIQQFCSSLGSLLSNVCESTDSAFKRVRVMKRGADGHLQFFNVNVNGGRRRSLVHSYIEDVRTGEIYKDEPSCDVAKKCALIALVMPLYTAGEMAWHLCKTPVAITVIALDAISKVGQLFVQGRLREGANEIKREFVQITKTFGNGLFQIIKTPLFGLGMGLVSLYGIAKPYHGRKFEAIIEHAWQNGVSYKHDFRNAPLRESESCWQAFLKESRQARPFYLAYCFQVRGNTAEPRITVIRRDPLLSTCR